VPGVTWSNGVPTRMHIVVSGWNAQDLEAYLLAAYEKAGLYVPPMKDQLDFMQELIVTGLDVDTKISYTTILQTNLDGTTTCILATANLTERRTPTGDPAPLFPGAKNVVRSDTESAQLIQYEAPGAKVDDVLKYYRDTLSRSGFQETSRLVFQRNDEQFQVIANPDKAGKTQVVVTRRLNPAEEMNAPPSP
jgi:hypothetical protein